jgi:hypothetical protein
MVGIVEGRGSSQFGSSQFGPSHRSAPDRFLCMKGYEPSIST